jgi:hypothetical protein
MELNSDDQFVGVVTRGCLSNKTALAMIFKLAQAAEKSLNRLRGHDHFPKVILGVKFNDGIEVVRSHAQTAAASPRSSPRFGDSSTTLPVHPVPNKVWQNPRPCKRRHKREKEAINTSANATSIDFKQLSNRAARARPNDKPAKRDKYSAVHGWELLSRLTFPAPVSAKPATSAIRNSLVGGTLCLSERKFNFKLQNQFCADIFCSYTCSQKTLRSVL